MTEQVWDVLRGVMDPEYPINLVDLGMVRGVSVSGGKVKVELTFTSTGCPCMDWIIQDVKEAVGGMEGVDEIEVETVWNKPWTANDLSEEAKKIMKSLNTAI